MLVPWDAYRCEIGKFMPEMHLLGPFMGIESFGMMFMILDIVVHPMLTLKTGDSNSTTIKALL